MFTIEDDIPLPEPSTHGRGNAPAYPFGAMKPGQSFVAPEPIAARAIDAAKHYRARHPNWNYTFKRSDAGVRIWRTG